MTREEFNKIAKVRFEAMTGFALESCTLIKCTEGLFVSIIAEGNRIKELAKLPNVDGSIDFDEELNETFAYVKLS